MKEEDFFRKLKKESILIYGAGMVGKLVYSRLMSAGMGEKVKGFAVTCKKEEGCRSCLGVPLYRIDELVSCGESVDVIAAAMPALQKEILEELHRRKFPNVWEISPDLYEDLARSYMQKFREKNPFPEKEIDVLFMASDNNSSSGAFLCMAELNTELNRRGMSTAVILPEYGNGAAILEQQGIPYTYVPSRHWCRRSEENWAWKRPSALKAASDLTQPSGQAQEGTHAIEEDTNAIEETAQIIRKGHVKVVHNNTTYAHTGALAARLAGIPYVWHIRENIAAQGFCFMEEGKARELFSQAAGVAAVSAYVASCYRGLSPSRTQVIYDGVDVRKYVRRDKELFRGNCVSILLAGVVTPLKRQEDLVEAAGFLKKWGIPFRVRFAGSGEGDYMSFLGRRVKELGLEHEVEFCGRQDSLEKYYQEADIVAVCSGAEAFGRTTVEAQLAGCLVAGGHTGTDRGREDRVFVPVWGQQRTGGKNPTGAAEPGGGRKDGPQGAAARSGTLFSGALYRTGAGTLSESCAGVLRQDTAGTLQGKRAAGLWRSAAGTWTGSKLQISARNRQRILCPGDGESSSEGRAPGCFRGRDGGPGGGDMSYRSAIFS